MAAETLARFGANRDDGAHVMTNGGGAGVMAADAAAARRHPALRPEDGDARASSTPRCRRRGRTATRSTSSATPRSAATPKRCRRCSPIRERRRAVPACADRDRAQRRHRARLRADRPPGAGPRDGLLAGRHGCRRGAPRLRRRRRRRLRDAGRSGARLRHARDLSAQPGPAARSADRERERPARIAAARALDLDARSPKAATMLGEADAKALLAAYGIPVATTVAVGPRPMPRPPRRGTSAFRSR